MLLIRGDLLLRYPNAIIYAHKAKDYDPSVPSSRPELDTSDATKRQFPVMRIDPAPGVTFLGFSLSPSPARPPAPGERPAGWFFVFEEHPTETRFGLDVSRKQGGLESWRELAWKIEGTEAGDVNIVNGYISTAPPDPKLADNAPAPDRDKRWGKNGAHMAYITLRPAYRFLVHSSIWYPDKFVSNPAQRKPVKEYARPAKPPQR
jgi:hypothetical protein